MEFVTPFNSAVECGRANRIPSRPTQDLVPSFGVAHHSPSPYRMQTQLGDHVSPEAGKDYSLLLTSMEGRGILVGNGNAKGLSIPQLIARYGGFRRDVLSATHSGALKRGCLPSNPAWGVRRAGAALFVPECTLHRASLWNFRHTPPPIFD